MSPLPLMSAPSSDPFKAIRMSAIDPHETLTMPLSPMPEPVMDTSAFGGSAPPKVESPRQQEENELTQKHQTRMAEQSAQPEGFGHKLLHGLNVFRNIAETSLVPGVAMADPTSELHKNLVDENRQERLSELQDRDLAERKEFTQEGLHQSQLALAGRKQDETENHHQQQTEQQLRAHGYKLDENGDIQPLAYEELSPQQQAITDLKQSQQSLADANEEVRRASLDPNSPAYQLALKKLDIAKQGHQAAMMRAQASLMNAYSGNYGTDTKGNALPGALLTPEGTPIGSHFSGNVRPTGQERNKADMAASADKQIDDMLSIVQKRPDIFGPAAGRTTDFQVWIGSQDPDAQRFRAARTIAGDHLAGTFGGRSEAALNALDNAIGHFKDNPAAVTAGLNQLKSANSLFQQRGTVHTVGGNNSEAPEEKSLGQTSKPDGVYEMNGKHYRVKGGQVYAH